MTINGSTDMIDLKKIYDAVIDEDAVMAAGDGGGDAGAGEVVAADQGTSVDDVLGKDCDHQNSPNGFFGGKCMHLPKNILSTDGSKRKKKKTPYEKDLKIVLELDDNG